MSNTTMESVIPVCDLQQQYATLQTEIDAAMQDVVAKGRYILGPNVRSFESEMAAYLGCRHAAGVGNGTDALHLALRALEIGPGDEVITTPFTFVATTEAIGIVGAKPVFVDINPQTFNIDCDQIESAITPRTKAIIPIHLFGQPCEIDRVLEISQRHGLRVVEDCAQAIGASYHGQKVGTFGDIGCFSFFPSKNLGCCGDGGMVVTEDDHLYERLEMLRRHGGRVKYHHSELGLNSRLDELQAAILRVKLPHLDRWSQLRRSHACCYNQLLEEQPDVVRPAELGVENTWPTPDHTANPLLTAVYHQYTVLVGDRTQVAQRLKEKSVATAVYYPVPLHQQEVHADLAIPRGAFPHSEHAADHCLSLPMFPELSVEQLSQVIDGMRHALNA